MQQIFILRAANKSAVCFCGEIKDNFQLKNKKGLMCLKQKNLNLNPNLSFIYFIHYSKQHKVLYMPKTI